MPDQPERGADLRDIGERIRLAIQKAGGNATVAKKSGIPVGTINNYIAGTTEAGALKLRAIAEATNQSVDWLLTGREPVPQNDHLVFVPLYDLQLSAGAGSWAQRARVIETIPFTKLQLAAIPGRVTASKLALFEIRGDSGGATLPDGSLAMADTADNRLQDGLFAFVQGDDCRVKRFHVRMNEVILSSDNPAYPPEHLAYDQLENLTIIGRIVWCGSPL